MQTVWIGVIPRVDLLSRWRRVQPRGDRGIATVGLALLSLVQGIREVARIDLIQKRQLDPVANSRPQCRARDDVSRGGPGPHRLLGAVALEVPELLVVAQR